MNKAAKVAIAVGTLAIVYSGSAWYLGRQIEASMDEQFTKVGNYPFLKVVDRKFERGIFSSTQTVSIEVAGDLIKPAAMPELDANGEPMPAPPPAPPMKITLLSQIKHGPLAGGTFAAAVADTELVLDEAIKKEITAVMGDKKPLQLHTVYRFDRGGVATLTSPAFTTTTPAPEGGQPGSLAWDGFTMSVDFARGLSSFTYKLDAPKIEVKEGNGTHFLLTNFSGVGDQKRIFEDEPMLFSGTQKFTINEINVSKPEEPDSAVLLNKLEYAIEMPINGEFMDIAAKIGAEGVQVGKKTFGPAHYDISMRHLHARTLAKFHRALLDMYADPAKLAKAEGSPDAFAPLSQSGLELLKQDPEIVIDRLSFTHPKGEAKLTARAKLNGITPEDLAMPLMMLGKLQASADISLPESFIGELAGDSPAVAPVAEGEAVVEGAQEEQGSAFKQQIDALSAQGFITQDKGMISSKIVFANGELTVNGKPFNPMAALAGGM